MHEYDIALKVLLQGSADSALRQLTGRSVARWLNVEIPQVQASRVDLLGATADENLVHLELQSSNDGTMALRMAEYTLRIYRQFGKFPKQIVLYVGEAPARMDETLRSSDDDEPDFVFRYRLVDIRDLDGNILLNSPHIEDNLLAILTGFKNNAGMVRQILDRITRLDDQARRSAFEQFLIISGLRRLAPIIKQEAERMPILNDIMDHEVIGPAIRQGREEGRQEGRQEVLRRLLERRFGPLPDWAATRLDNLSTSEFDEVTIRVLDAASLEDLFSANS
jgi:predicted transposase/invertase (TIGR01784 family)